MLPPLTWWSLPDYGSFTVVQILSYVLFATMGWIARVSVSDSTVLLPTWDGVRFRLNLLGEWITAVLVGLLANHNILVVACAAAGAPTIVRIVLDAVPHMVRRFFESTERHD